ncbi:MAG: preprotein translocase subunit SecA, partial [Firmicutes bacterium]|nr:preprotein translocase subunit SecA [Bacillota bacterium]
HVPSQRIDRDMEIYYDAKSKWEGVVKAIKEAHQKGQPILAGTGSIFDSEHLAELLKAQGVNATVLNAKNDSEEAEIISNAGAAGAVTISTNMAGRGVDIKLGGADERTRDEVVKAGGLLVISTYMPESSRIVKQLLGRSGRQGDVGETRSFVSVDEPIMERCKLNSLLPPKHIPRPSDEAIEDRVLLREVERVQRISEGNSFDARSRLLKFTMIGEKHREQIFEARTRILRGKSPNIWKSFEGYKEAAEQLGQEKLDELEKKTAVAAANRFWSDYLEYTEQLRRGIHLMEVSGRSPSEEYNIIVEEYYQGMEEELKTFMGEQLDLLLEKGEADYEIEVPKNIHTYLLEDTGDELNKLPFLFNVFDEEEEEKPKKAEKKAPSILEKKEEETEAEPKKKGFLFWKKKK